MVAEPSWGYGDYVSAGDVDDLGDLDRELERLLADGGWPSDESALAYGSLAPSGELAVDLDIGTADAAGLSDESLVEAIVGFDRLASWAAARQARLLDELARRRPADRAPESARWACVGSEYAPDEVGVALRLSRGSACARIGLARRLLATLPDTHTLWESGLIDTSKARAIDDATVVLFRRARPHGRSPGVAEGPGADSGRAQSRAGPRGDRRPTPRAPRNATGRPCGIGGWW